MGLPPRSRYDTNMHGFSVTRAFPMHWGEMDALGHANNARYFTWFETARIAYFDAVCLNSHTPGALGPILATTTCNFKKSIVYPVDLVVGARVTRLGNTSFTMEYAVAPADAPDDHHATGSGVIVLINYETHEKIPMPDDLRAKIHALEHHCDDLAKS